MNTGECVDTVYNERGNFIVIGFTGRTGSGCSEAANILCEKNFDELSLKTPESMNCSDTEDRKYKLIYNYAKRNWSKFEKISMSAIIFSFVLQIEFEKLENKFRKIIPEIDTTTIKDIFQDIKECDGFVKKYNDTRKKLIRSKNKLLDENNRLKRDEKSQKLEYEIFSDVKDLHNKFKEIAKKYTYTVEKEVNVNKGTNVEKEVDKKKKQYKANVYSSLWQQIANKIRQYGDLDSINDESKEKPENMYSLARRTNDFIKAIRRYKNKQNTLICIDAIRNPYEAFYFKDRYSAFYLVSINTEDEERRRRLSFMSKDEIDSLDDLEYPKKPKGMALFTQQNIAACIEISDIHIYNPKSKGSEKLDLIKQLVKYVTLMKHPGLVTPTHIERCMQEAFNAKLNSGCLSRQVGAVITDENFSIKAVGWNDVPEGQVPCALRDLKDLKICKDNCIYSDFEIEDKEFNEKIDEIYGRLKDEYLYCGKLKGRSFQYCFKDVYTAVTGKKNQVHTRALHAEENAFLQISKYGGQGIKGGNLFCTASPCELCSKKAYQLGIRHIYYIDPYPGISKKHILAFKNLNGAQIETHLFDGAIGKAYTALYSQRLSIKDELELLVGDVTEAMSLEEIKKELKEKDVNFINDLNESTNVYLGKISILSERCENIPLFLFKLQADGKEEKFVSKSVSYIDELSKFGLIELKEYKGLEGEFNWIKTLPVYDQLLETVDDAKDILLHKFTLKVTEVGKEILAEKTKEQNPETTSSENSDVKQ